MYLLLLVGCGADGAWDTARGDTADTGRTWAVDCGGGGELATIQAAIDAAADGDRIALGACTYHERIDYRGKRLDIYGVDGPDATIIDGGLGGTVVRVVSGEGLDTRLAGVTVRGGYNPLLASAIEVDTSALRLDDVVLAGNGEAYAVLHASDAFLTATNVDIAGNATTAEGIALYSSGGGLTAEGLAIDCDGGWYGIYQHNGATIDDAAVTCARGYALYSHHAEFRLHRSSFVGGIAGIYAAEDSVAETSQRAWMSNVYAAGATGIDIRHLTMELINSVVTGTVAGLNVAGVDPASGVSNSIFLDAPCGIAGDGGTLAVTYSNFWNNAADTCAITADAAYRADPRFVDYPSNLALAPDSPLRDAGDPTSFDPDGTRSDVGAHGGPLGAW